jgi:hypothetical protein
VATSRGEIHLLLQSRLRAYNRLCGSYGCVNSQSDINKLVIVPLPTSHKPDPGLCGVCRYRSCVLGYPKAKIRPNEDGRVYNFAHREGDLAIPATSNLKRSRTLPNRSREDRIRDGPFKRMR